MTQTRRQQQKQQTRNHIVSTAMSQFAGTGLTKTRTAEIAKAANVSHGTLFVHFATQEELVTEVISQFGSTVNNRLHELAAGRRKLGEVLEAHLTGLTEHEELYTWLIVENRLLPEHARNIFISIQSTISHHIGEAAVREMEAGSIRHMPLHLLFNGWVGLVHHYLINRDLFAPGGSVLKQCGEELLKHYMGLLAHV
ncbi:MAG: transcriptional regulator, TetR family [Paenibacillaceae bacterium]|jgi:AcrR family transcriptional regulator|nr:transcriptional regulator, TetR family [Paenibacillaceae bacterium]